ncbi:lipase family alpha/beta hydrolase [Serinicoccus kebangsaanensis]|uniref:lipase family alpha/beta hydrolase n=1 Tax=Serinicoccus kebangsaanensis TaxID=2602069 RepID=UPI00124C51A9|nr:hypothetical protein [Serinicoccus kebangsaanensis]
MRDLVITLPGIMGSCLRRDAESLWDPGPGLVTKLLRHRRWVAGLALDPDDDPTLALAPDGVVPTTPIRSHTIVPGLVELDGYTELDGAVRRAFPELIEGDPLRPGQRLDGRDPQQAGVPDYYQFAYDWRRDVRSAALRLHDLVEVALPALVAQRSPQAKVVLVGHSMGGLVARYYLYGTDLRTGTALAGWRNVREVLTLGTPYRGSVDALSYLLFGYRKLFVDLTDAARSFPSIYQLLPRYRVVHDQRSGEDRWLYPHELGGYAGLDVPRARSAYEDFHGVMDQGLEQAESAGRRLTTPHIGFGHPTHNSVVLTGHEVEVRRSAPDYVDQVYDSGDGTVPLLSAIPLELDEERSRLRYTNQRHGSLQADRRTLESEIQQRLRQSQSGTSDARESAAAADSAPALGLAGPSAFLAGEAPYVDVSVTGGEEAGGLVARVHELVGGTSTTVEVEGGGRVDLPSAPGEYRVEVSCASPRLTSTCFYAVVEPEG